MAAQTLLPVKELKEELDVEGQKSQDVDEVHERPEEGRLRRREDDPDDEFDGEEDGADVVEVLEEEVRYSDLRRSDDFVVPTLPRYVL